MAGVLIVPAQPPLPTAWNFPFQSSAGSQSSISIWESGDGARTAATRQWAGSEAGACPGAPAGGGPAGRSSAAVMVTPGRSMFPRLSHGTGAAAAANSRARWAIMAQSSRGVRA